MPENLELTVTLVISITNSLIKGGELTVTLVISITNSLIKGGLSG